jgi:hypothetical protein
LKPQEGKAIGYARSGIKSAPSFPFGRSPVLATIAHITGTLPQSFNFVHPRGST